MTDDANDNQQIEPMLDRWEELHDERPGQVLAYAGYWSEANTDLENDETNLFIATTKDWRRRKELMERNLRTKRGRGIYTERSTSVEPVFGQLVMRGLDRFLLRGKDGAKAEWSIFWATRNLLKVFRSGWTPDGVVGATAICG